MPGEVYRGTLCDGNGNASKVFADNRCTRMREIHAVLGFFPFPGTLNVQLDRDFDRNHPRIEGDLPSRRRRPCVAWFWKVTLDENEGWIFCFPDAKRDWSKINVIAPYRLRDRLSEEVEICVCT